MEQQAKLDLGGVAAIILAIATLCTSIGAIGVQFYTLARVEQGIHQTNSLKDELVASTRKDALAEGEKKGLQQGRDGK